MPAVEDHFKYCIYCSEDNSEVYSTAALEEYGKEAIYVVFAKDRRWCGILNDVFFSDELAFFNGHVNSKNLVW